MLPLLLSDYQYDLPYSRIARFPLAERDQSKLLVYRHGDIRHQRFDQLGDFLPDKSLLVFNDTKVIPARMHVRRPTGGLVELFLLEPLAPSTLLAEALAATDTTTWQCLIGNQKRWKEGVGTWVLTVDNRSVALRAELVDGEKAHVRFSWGPGEASFAEILHAAGQIPLPPYLKREATEADRQTYQTVYSAHEGAVAAPTAGLHFTDRVLTDLRQRGFVEEFLTLHVGAGTFQPVKVENALDHRMHGEQVILTRHNVQTILAHLGRVIPVGTTSMRSLETLYWLGAQWAGRGAPAAEHSDGTGSFFVGQFEPYRTENPPPPAEALTAVLDRMNAANWDRLVGKTELMIMPGYPFRLCNGLITNFHQPGSTLILLVAALVGTAWRRIYDEALAHDYRFLSYGDSSLLLP
jgi:S-adenosylmethionine:tRNA ribosyltransferase-isomerase